MSSAPVLSPVPETIIRLRGLRKVYKTGKVSVEALRGVDLDVPKGEFLSVVGPSATIRPRAISTARSAFASASSR